MDSYSRRKYYFGSFDSSNAFQDVGLKAYDELASRRQKDPFTGEVKADGTMRNKSFYRADTEAELDGVIDTFIDMPLVTETVDGFDGILEKIDMGGAFEKARLIATRNKQGIFDFGLASKGLFRPSEYYSEDLASRFPEEFPSFNEPSGVVPPDFVKNKKVNGKIYFWYSKDGEDFICQQRQYGVTKALDEDPDLETKMFGNMLILTKPNKNLRFASTYDKCYLMHKKEGGKAKSVDLYVIQGGLGDVSEKGMILKTMPVLLAAKILEEAGIRTRVYASRAYTSDSNTFFFTYPVKNYGADIDWNELALNVGDPRIFRWKTWKSIAGILKKDYPSIDWTDDNGGSGYGRTIYGGDLMDEAFERYKGYIGAKSVLGDSNKKSVDRTLMLLGNVENVDALESGDKKRVQELILEEFYRIMDTVDFQFNQTNKVADRVFKREIESGKTKREIKEYLNKILKRAYSVPRAGDFAATQQEQDKIFTTLDDKLEKLYQYYEKNNY